MTGEKPLIKARTSFAAFTLAILISGTASAKIPAAPVMSYYAFGGKHSIPYYTVESFERNGPRKPAGTIALGSSILPCLVIRGGKPLTDSSGTPYVGFEMLVDARRAGPDSTKRYKEAVAKRSAMEVENHHCPAGVKHVVDVRKFFAMEKAPFFDPPRPRSAAGKDAGIGSKSSVDEIVRAFHNSPQCEAANSSLMGRRDALAREWNRFVAKHRGKAPEDRLERARHLDYTMRTAIYEGHLDRGCSAYGACERNVIALSIRNRGRIACQRSQGCAFPGDFQGVSSKVSQYNIWDEYLTQISGLTSCFLRDDLQRKPAGGEAPYNASYYIRIGRMYEQNAGDVEKILFGSDGDLASVFPRTPRADLVSLRHYYHPPAMRKCFPNHPRVEYMSGAVARNGKDYALIANTRIEVGRKTGGDYLFKIFDFTQEGGDDVVALRNLYPGFAVDGRKVSLRISRGCVPYGIPSGCRHKKIGRYRTVPGWLKAGRPVAITCETGERGESCEAEPRNRRVTVGFKCDKEMVPVAGVR